MDVSRVADGARMTLPRKGGDSEVGGCRHHGITDAVPSWRHAPDEVALAVVDCALEGGQAVRDDDQDRPCSGGLGLWPMRRRCRRWCWAPRVWGSLCARNSM